MAVQAYVYHGNWIAECSRDGCSNAEFLFWLRYADRPASAANPREVRKGAFLCTNCGGLDTVDWPEEGFVRELDAVLAARPVPDTRNWYPAGHPVAVTCRLPHGQSLAEVRAESEAHGVPVPG